MEEENLGAAGTRGIAIYLLDSLVYSSVELGYATTVWVEHMVFSINLTNKQSALIGCMYRSPSANIERSTMAVCNIISLALNIEHTHFLLVSDFNYNDIDWENEYVYQHGSKDNPSESKLLKCSATFMECVHDCLHFQHVKEPTRFRHSHNPSLIDLTFTNEEGMVDEITYLGLGNSDHACLRFILKCDNQVRQEFMPTYNFFKCDYGSLGSKFG